MSEDLFLALEGVEPPKPKLFKTGEDENSLKASVQREKQERKQREQADIEAVLAKKDEILKCLIRGIHYRPNGDDDRESIWLAGRGGKGIKLKDGRLVRVALVGLYPGTKEINHRPQPAVLVGPSGKFLDKLLAYSIDHLDDVYRTNLIKYFKKPKSKITAAEKHIGKVILFEELKAKKIDYVICLGAEVYDVLCKEKKRFSASRFRGVFLPPDKAHIPVHIAGLQNPAFIISPEGEKESQNFEDALRSLFEIIHDGERQFNPPPYSDISTPAEAVKWLEDFEAYVAEQKAASKRILFALDTEVVSETSGGSLEPREMIMITTSYGNEDAEKVEDLHNHSWTFQKTPEWDYLSGLEDAYTQSTLGIFGSEEETEADHPEESKRVNLVFDPRTEEGRIVQTKIRDLLNKGVNVAALDISKIEPTDLTQPIGKKTCQIALTRAIQLADESVLQHGHFDKRALEVGISFNWDHVSFEPDPENPDQERVSTKLKELMIETLTLNENDNRGLKEVCSKTLGWKGYDIPLEMFKAQHDVENYIHIPWKNLAPYAIWDVAGTLLAKLAKERQRKKKWKANAKTVRKYYDTVAQITGHQHSDPEVQTPEAITSTLNQLMVPLFRIKKTGMPIGDEGMKKVGQLVDFYSSHYEKLRQEIAALSKDLIGRELNDPGSTDLVNFVLYGPKEKGGLGLEPFKEPGKGGRLWTKLNAEERLRSAGTGAIDGESFAVLEGRIDDHNVRRFVKRLGETRQIKSIMDNFFADPNEAEKGFFSRIGADGRLHTEYMPTTETLRFRSQPNLANPPKKESKWVKKIVGEAPPWELRNIITALPGHVLLNRDWSSAEVYLLMYRSNDPAGLDVIAKGLDFHIKIGTNANKDIQLGLLRWKDKDPAMVEFIRAFVAENQKDPSKAEALFKDLIKLFESDVEKHGYKLLKVLFDTERSKIKPVTFGVPYGQTPEGLARANGMEIPEAEIYIAGYHSTYKTASAYLAYNGRFGTDFRLMPNPWGYLRNFSPRQRDDEVERQAFNLALQHGVACLMNQALIDWENAKRRYRLKSEVFLSLYDAIGWHVPMDEAQTVAEISHEIMTVKRPVGPFDNRTIPTEGIFTEYWEGDKVDGMSFKGLNLL